MSSSKLLNLSLLLVCLFALVSAQKYITPRDCPKNETYLPCGPSCQTECATLNEPCLIRHIRCPDGCYCNKGYARNAAGTCIPIGQCPKQRGPY
ncbi:inducible metalloproteinase inhibitor protein [Drosophila nasuta]|uniref:inducible metalloproteinase inhibitor protein n=1 Tax=Drosophila nasuta TaxID=42062 RepID=UPI00295E5633|nr:inducible metalloproteinase inhibitor protein [Drosophila nasuta]